MLYGNKEVQEEILKQVRKFEEKYNKKVVFGAMVGRSEERRVGKECRL